MLKDSFLPAISRGHKSVEGWLRKGSWVIFVDGLVLCRFDFNSLPDVVCWTSVEANTELKSPLFLSWRETFFQKKTLWFLVLQLQTLRTCEVTQNSVGRLHIEKWFRFWFRPEISQLCSCERTQLHRYHYHCANFHLAEIRPSSLIQSLQYLSF